MCTRTGHPRINTPRPVEVMAYIWFNYSIYSFSFWKGPRTLEFRSFWARFPIFGCPSQLEAARGCCALGDPKILTRWPDCTAHLVTGGWVWAATQPCGSWQGGGSAGWRSVSPGIFASFPASCQEIAQPLPKERAFTSFDRWGAAAFP